MIIRRRLVVSMLATAPVFSLCVEETIE